ncbi:tubby-related protein 4 isoform X3 [Strongylocentrotus purpuratus]|uniref:SOCS box domain-containing protein n=1 Tax=Strongylocentrotus purpuratus TaxID=7668 RepID=A0A7M7PIA2_STRPU|nr:tubby-related protein 4 isoform X3 [Strongylocentrotus purpuratus]
MYAVLEQNPAARSDCTILSLSWKGTVPESEKDKSYTRKRHYTKGWLATGNVKGVVGATYTTSHCGKSPQAPARRNFNLRGHNSEVVLVRWNEPFQKMATCDAQGVIFVWIKYEGRWSVELVNDRSCQVSDFSWSHDGRMALICYKDGFVLVGSVTGQRYWSSLLDLDAKLLCGAWAPDDKQVLLGTSKGEIVVMDIHGALVTQCNLATERPLKALLWSSEKFRMVNIGDCEGEDRKKRKVGSDKRNRSKRKSPVMAIDLGDGEIQLMRSHDDLTPICIKTGMTAVKMEWSGCGSFLAVGGTQPVESISAVKFYDTTGHLRFTLNIPSQRPLSALTWGHNDQRLFVACGSILHVAWIEKGVAPLQVLCREVIQPLTNEEKLIAKLPLPLRLRNYVCERLSLTIKGCIPDPAKLREFVSQPPPGNERLHCTMVRTEFDSRTGSPCFTLFLEFLGGLVPLLKGRRISKLRPEFVIYDPKTIPKSNDDDGGVPTFMSSDDSSCTDDSDEDLMCNMRRKTDNRNSSSSPKPRDSTQSASDSPRLKEKEFDSLFLDSLPERNPLVEVTSNIWGTKFKIHGLAEFLPANLGQINYRTSLLHLQPRQMTIALVELKPEFLRCRQDEDSDYDPNVFSEDDDDVQDVVKSPPLTKAAAAPIAPMTSTNRSFSDTMDSNNHNLVSELTQQNNAESQTVEEGETDSIPLLAETTREEYTQQGAIPKQRLVSQGRRKIESECGSTSIGGGRTGPLDVVTDVRVMNGGAEALDEGIILPSDVQGEEELQTDLPRWADTAPRHSRPGHLCDGPGSNSQSPKRIARRREHHESNGHGSVKDTDVRHVAIMNGSPQIDKVRRAPISVDESDLDLSEPVRASSPKPCQTPVDEKGKEKKHTASSPQTKTKRSKLKGRKAENGQEGAATEKQGSPKLSGSAQENSSGKSRKSLRKAWSNSDRSPSRSRMKSQGENSDSDAENQNANEAGDSSTASSAKSRKAKLMKQYANCKSKVFVMHNKAPLWNENTQVYQLDFGGRVTQESAKNFQVELLGKQIQVMQFGKIDGQAYTLDFQSPFSAIQAFAIALANVTQRLK